MNIQLALDRMGIAEAIQLSKEVEPHIDWIEVGTSLIKEFGMASVTEIKQAFPTKTIVADIKTIDNARYEFELCFQAGADVATVMGVSPLVTIDACMEVAKRYNKKVMIDLLNTTDEQKNSLLKYNEAIFCDHVSKDQQEESGNRNIGTRIGDEQSIQLAVAGGITFDSIGSLIEKVNPDVVIVGSAITKANNPSDASKKFKQLILQAKGE
ncbi:3-hexulose-6-phosphate synthase [Gottfriedia acidiceleris]|uniref:3-hexulose-6-phosphate synthase n=1 Tax=Bacillaceae TaxID=186817 RepID=UPI000BED1B3D|nr:MULTISPECIES: 3-hexulose-6-phosphate synthase [unclassified Bacillus (in: firmicutes)]PEC50311.1 3-hexulose-6-phosphate synthase [Bacillus sp. AFS096315]PFM74945.1 3-hexulose-6-phosphate synthase [Bacillus sp. AFS077874]